MSASQIKFRPNGNGLSRHIPCGSSVDLTSICVNYMAQAQTRQVLGNYHIAICRDVKLALLSGLIGEPAYAQLRTRVLELAASVDTVSDRQ